jgi:hypothetical protein
LRPTPKSQKGRGIGPRPNLFSLDSVFDQLAGLLVLVSTFALLGLMCLLAWSPTLLTGFLVAWLLLLLLARSLFFLFRGTLIVL